ncbi:MAG: hypothetical protein JXR75_03070 [Rhodobacteraceae bacterium]|nr:hypothetical protein [Paracoccaceae bacterium]
MRLVCTALLVCLTLSQPLRANPGADLVIEGRPAQALHCAAMLFIVSSELFEIGEISRNSRDAAQRAALVMLDQVPGTDEQRRRAMVQRFERIMASRTPAELSKEYADTARWCRNAFLR